MLTAQHFNTMWNKWEHTDLIKKMNVVAIALFVMVTFIFRFVYYFLVEIQPLLEPYNAWIVLLVFCVITYIMYMLPVVPGGPMSIFAGMVCVHKFAKDSFLISIVGGSRDDEGASRNAFYVGILLMCPIVLFLKLFASFGQQKLYGERIGAKSPAILSIVGVHKPLMR